MLTRAELIAAYLSHRWLPDGRFVGVMPLTFGRARLCVSPPDDLLFVADSYRYDTPEAAVAAMLAWDGTGEPQGWMRHPPSGRRRSGGDANQEYVNL